MHGRGPLNASNGFTDQGDVLIKTRMAATALGATPMDRPEWTSVDPVTGLVYLTLTNNTSSSKVENAPNPRKPNRWGHIIRWEEAGGDHTATAFTWDIFLLAGPGRDSATPDGSTVNNCEVTGVITTPDQRTMFVNLQHPGEGGGSTWPHDDGLATPRSATVVVTKDDGSVVGT